MLGAKPLVLIYKVKKRKAKIIEFSISEKVHLDPRMDLGFFIFRFNAEEGFRLFSAPLGNRVPRG